MSESIVGPGEFYQVVGVGPHSKPWPTDNHFDPELLEQGDRRNVLDKYRYWKLSAIVADLDTKRHDLQIANAFNVSAVHIVGKRDWNRRGAMVTDRYLTVHHHATVAEFKAWCDNENLPIIGIDNLPVSKQLESTDLPKRCVMLFGQEGAGMSDEGVAICTVVLAISQYGSTRSMNASAAGAIAMYAWAMQHLNPTNHPKK